MTLVELLRQPPTVDSNLELIRDKSSPRDNVDFNHAEFDDEGE